MVNIRVICILCFPIHRKILLNLDCLAVHLNTPAQVLVSVGFDTEGQKGFKKNKEIKKKEKEKTPTNLTVTKTRVSGLLHFDSISKSGNNATGDPSSAGSPKRRSSVTQSKYFHFTLRKEGEVCGGRSCFSEGAAIGLPLFLSIY